MKVAVIGAGGNGSHHAQGLSEMDGVQVVGVADPCLDKAQATVAGTGGTAVRISRSAWPSSSRVAPAK